MIRAAGVSRCRDALVVGRATTGFIARAFKISISPGYWPELWAMAIPASPPPPRRRATLWKTPSHAQLHFLRTRRDAFSSPHALITGRRHQNITRASHGCAAARYFIADVTRMLIGQTLHGGEEIRPALNERPRAGTICAAAAAQVKA